MKIIARQSHNCIVKGDVQECQVTERGYGTDTEQEVKYKTWLNSSNPIQLENPITQRCTVIINNDLQELETTQTETCIVHNILPNGLIFDVYYFNNDASDNLEAVEVFNDYYKEVKMLTKVD